MGSGISSSGKPRTLNLKNLDLTWGLGACPKWKAARTEGSEDLAGIFIFCVVACYQYPKIWH